jgi:hypothetical protein
VSQRVFYHVLLGEHASNCLFVLLSTRLAGNSICIRNVGSIAFPLVAKVTPFMLDEKSTFSLDPIINGDF